MLMPRYADSLFGLSPAETPKNLSLDARVAVISQIQLESDGITRWQSYDQPYTGRVVGFAGTLAIKSDETLVNVWPDEPLYNEGASVYNILS
jgi:hypothetical protein